MQTPIKNQRGQTIIEYILLLVVILGIAYSIGRNFLTPLQKFGTSVFTSTIACALEYGQLPAEITSEDGCSASMHAGASTGSKGGSSGGGKPGKTSDSSKGGPGGKDGKSSKDQGKDASAKKSENGESGSNSSASSSGAGGASRSGGGLVTSVNTRNGTLQLSNNSGGAENRGARSEIVYDSSNSDSGDVDYSYGGSRVRRRKPLYKPILGEVADEFASQKKKEKTLDKGSARGLAGGYGADEGKPKRVEVNSTQRTKKADTQSANWDMSKMLRMALIILMIFAILLFVFFQVSQVRRGSGSS